MTETTGSSDYQKTPSFDESSSRGGVAIETQPEAAGGPIGLDVGTSNIVMAQNRGSKLYIAKQLNAFFAIPQSKFTRQILIQNEIIFFEHNRQFFIVGDSAENFANMFNTNTKRPMELGLLSLREDEGIAIIQAIIKSLIQRPKRFGELICFSVPGQILTANLGTSPVDSHESVIKMYLESLGYSAIAINEGLAAVMAELADDNYTGIGISMGGGLCNICLSYMSVPVITYSIPKGGDYIDEKASHDVGIPATQLKGIKEEGIDLLALPRNKTELALQVYYLDVITHLVNSMEQIIGASDKMPKITDPIPIVISGGTAKAKGLKERFETSLKSIRLPMEISTVRISKDPLHTTAKGALAMAISESK
jgi:actin-like ATPase involved in cell morphogenesis